MGLAWPFTCSPAAVARHVLAPRWPMIARFAPRATYRGRRVSSHPPRRGIKARPRSPALVAGVVVFVSLAPRKYRRTIVLV
ncbi:hypothetical protein PR202_ga03628 [Eleusine coracana subsp. coracana]|uniref:Uncharacterized protein n=1 Tax=Eleusine coracana subsp. coracana TaxID=191504 RepID=A0AAV5BN48_ELECO|nr:hypothetical protein PR202_ga03628 [Eleusine coracana subsp. coracana]